MITRLSELAKRLEDEANRCALGHTDLDRDLELCDRIPLYREAAAALREAEALLREVIGYECPYCAPTISVHCIENENIRKRIAELLREGG